MTVKASGHAERETESMAPGRTTPHPRGAEPQALGIAVLAGPVPPRTSSALTGLPFANQRFNPRCILPGAQKALRPNPENIFIAAVDPPSCPRGKVPAGH